MVRQLPGYELISGMYNGQVVYGRVLRHVKSGDERYFQLGDDSTAIDEEWERLRDALELRPDLSDSLPFSVLGEYFIT